MSQPSSSKWDFGRFIQTLNYFEVFPFCQAIKSIAKMFGRVSNSPESKGKSVEVPDENSMDRVANEKVIFDFTRASNDLADIWGALDDVVMGGVSASSFRLENNLAVFSGNVSTDNSGGFVSIRTRNFSPALDLSQYQGIRLRVCGDGNRYKFMVRSESKWDGVAYCFSFDTIPDTWIDVQVPFDRLIPVFRAKTLSDAEKLSNQAICALQLMLSKFEYDGALNPNFTAGFFQIQLESIAAF